MVTRMVSVGKLEPFEGGLQEWVSYVEHFEQFLVANDITEAKKVMAIFLTAVGAKTYELLKDTGVPAKPLELKFEEVVEHLNKHYDPKSLVIAERFKFHKRNQQADESIAEYCAALRKYAWTCQFGTFLDEALRDRIVCGMKDPATQRRLLTESKLTLAKALEIAQGMEAAAKQAQQLTSEMSTPADRSTFKIDVMGKGRTRDTSRLVVGVAMGKITERPSVVSELKSVENVMEWAIMPERVQMIAPVNKLINNEGKRQSTTGGKM